MVLIAAGHTGGHLFPAVYIAQAIKEIDPSCEIEFVGAGKPLEAEIVDSRGFKRHVIDAVGFKKKGAKDRLIFFIRFPLAFFQAWRIISKTKPSAVVGAGGYVSFFPILAAALRGIPTWIHEVEMRPGLTNRVLGKIAAIVSVAHEETMDYFRGKALLSGHAINPAFFSDEFKTESPDAPSRLLVVGGSQGADSVDRMLISAVEDLAKLKVKVVHQSRAENIEMLRAAYAKAGIEAEVLPFIRDMASAYKNADVVVGRSGAGTILEVSLINRPAIFVPLPHAAGNEQLHNAQVLVRAGKALCIEEGPNIDARFHQALSFVFSKDAFQRMKSIPNSRPPRNGAKTIAEGIVRLINP